MDIEKQVCTLEQSRRLKEIGLNQLSAFYWVNDFDIWEVQFYLGYKASILCDKYSAYTAAELIKMNGSNSGIETGATKENKGKFYMQTGGFGEDNKPVFTYYESFAEASAAKLINALENEWLDVETCNSRLLE